jgi:hypothetical protein
MYEQGQEWSQVVATESGTVLIAAGRSGLGRYDSARSEMTYLGNSGKTARHMALIDNDASVAVAFENGDEAMSFRWEVDVFSTTDRSEFPRFRLNSRAESNAESERSNKGTPS